MSGRLHDYLPVVTSGSPMSTGPEGLADAPSGAAGVPRGYLNDDSFEALASWPALANFIEDIGEHDTSLPPPPPPVMGDFSLARSHSMPGAIGQGGGLSGHDMFCLARQARANGIRSGLFPTGQSVGAPAADAADGADRGPKSLGGTSGSDVHVRLSSLLGKVRPSRPNAVAAARTLAPWSFPTASS